MSARSMRRRQTSLRLEKVTDLYAAELKPISANNWSSAVASVKFFNPRPLLSVKDAQGGNTVAPNALFTFQRACHRRAFHVAPRHQQGA